jgi:hypothetical protein
VDATDMVSWIRGDFERRLENLSVPANQALAVALVEQEMPLKLQRGHDELVDIATKPEVEVREPRCPLCDQSRGQAHADEECEAIARVEEMRDHLAILSRLLIKEYECAKR